MLMLSQENEPEYVGDEDPREAGWSEEVPQQTERWVSGVVILVDAGCVENDLRCSEYRCASLLQDEPRQKRPARNFNARRNFHRVRNRHGSRMKRNANKGKECIDTILRHVKKKIQHELKCRIHTQECCKA